MFGLLLLHIIPRNSLRGGRAPFTVLIDGKEEDEGAVTLGGVRHSKDYVAGRPFPSQPVIMDNTSILPKLPSDTQSAFY